MTGRGRRWPLAVGVVVLVVGAAGVGWWGANQFGGAEVDQLDANAGGEGREADDGSESGVEQPTDDAEGQPEDPSERDDASGVEWDVHSWQRVTHDEDALDGDGHQAMESVIETDRGLVAVGRDVGRGAAAVWVSSDGRGWERVDHDEAVFGGDGQQFMYSVVETGQGLIAVGHDLGRDAAAVWVSPDGRDWERVDHDDAVFGGEGLQRMSSVADTDRGLVAVGDDVWREAAAVWVSSDGRGWERVDHDEAVFGGDGQQFMYSVVESGQGLVAVGSDSGQEAAAVWVSSNGRGWERVEHDEAVFGGDGRQQMSSLAEIDGVLVAVGRDGGRGAAAVWVSPDGRDWERVDHDEAVLGGDSDQRMVSVVASAQGLVVVGSEFDEAEEEQSSDPVLAEEDREAVAAVWVSSNGRGWERVEHDEAVFGGDGRQQMSSLAEIDGVLVAVGRDGGRGAAAVWTNP